MTWKTASTDPRVPWHWFGLSQGPAICGLTFGNKAPLGSSEKIKGRMKACPQCVRKLARQASVETLGELVMTKCQGCKEKVPDYEIIDGCCYLCRLKAHKEGHA